MKTKIKMMLFTLFVSAISYAQSPVDGFMKKKGKGSITLSLSTESYDEVFLVPQKVNRVPVFDQVNITATSIYADYGLTDNLMVIANLPYIRAEGFASTASQQNNGFENVREGLQDLGLYAKYRFYSKKMSSGSLDFMASAGVEFPVGDYRVDEGLQSIIAIGNRSTDINGLGIVSYQHNSGFFTTGQLGYSFRNNEVPNALLSELKLGYAANGFYIDAFVANQLSSDGVDILRPGFTGFFPATEVNFTRIGFSGYVPVTDYLGISSGINTIIAGRNIGDATGFYGGLTFSF